MRLGLVLVLAAVLPVHPTAAGARPGRTVRIEKPPRLEVFVPAGAFAQGVSDDAAAAALNQCQLAYFPPNQTQHHQNASGQVINFCGEYHKDLTNMPLRQVYLDAYAIDRDEVTVAAYRRCVASGSCTLDALVGADARYIRDTWPMVNVTWDEAQTYCRWRGARLPTEAEWERAARGDHGAAWPWGELEQPDDFNHGQARVVSMREIDRQIAIGPFPPVHLFGDPDPRDGAALLAVPGSYPWGTSPHGTRDQAGNVAEWTADVYLADDDHRGYQGLPAANPVRDGRSTHKRVIRGGSWRQPRFLGRPNLRDPFNAYVEATQRYSHVGFRCARGVR